MLKRMLAVLLLVVLFPGPCLAHKVILNAWIEGGQLGAEVAFSDGSPASGAVVGVFDPETGAELFSAKADEQGVVEAALPLEAFAGNGGLLVVGNAGAGHRAERLLPAREVDGPRKTREREETGEPHAPEPSPAGGAVDDAALEALVRQAVRTELAPLLREVRAGNDHGPRLQDVVGGIGYILGLAGLLMLVKGRQGRKNREGSGTHS